MKKTVGLKELRENMDKYVRRVNKGESFVVLRKSKPVFTISSVDDDEDMWDTVVDFTKIRNEGVPAEEVLRALKKMNEQDRKISKKTRK